VARCGGGSDECARYAWQLQGICRLPLGLCAPTSLGLRPARTQALRPSAYRPSHTRRPHQLQPARDSACGTLEVIEVERLVRVNLGLLEEMRLLMVHLSHLPCLPQIQALNIQLALQVAATTSNTSLFTPTFKVITLPGVGCPCSYRRRAWIGEAEPFFLHFPCIQVCTHHHSTSCTRGIWREAKRSSRHVPTTCTMAPHIMLVAALLQAALANALHRGHQGKELRSILESQDE